MPAAKSILKKTGTPTALESALERSTAFKEKLKQQKAAKEAEQDRDRRNIAEIGAIFGMTENSAKEAEEAMDSTNLAEIGALFAEGLGNVQGEPQGNNSQHE